LLSEKGRRRIKMTRQKPHYRISKKGRKFKAGRGKKRVKKKYLATLMEESSKRKDIQDVIDAIKFEKKQLTLPDMEMITRLERRKAYMSTPLPEDD